MTVTVPENFRITEDRNFIRPKRFDAHDFGRNDVLPPVYPNVEETIKQFPEFASYERGVILYAWCFNNGDTNIYTFVQRTSPKKDNYWVNGITGVGACRPRNQESVIKRFKVPKMQKLLTQEGIQHQKVKPDEISFNQKVSKDALISTLRIGPNFSFAALQNGPFGYAAYVEGPQRKFPSPKEIKEDTLETAKITDIMRTVFTPYFLELAPVQDWGF